MRQDAVLALLVILAFSLLWCAAAAVLKVFEFECGKTRVESVGQCNPYMLCEVKLNDGRTHYMFDPLEGDACQ